MAQATLKLYSVLAKYLPAEAKENKTRVDLAEGETVGQLIHRFSLPEKSCHLVLLNGVFVAPEARASTVIGDGDAVAIWPPVAGG